MPTPPWTGEHYMVSIKQGTRFGLFEMVEARRRNLSQIPCCLIRQEPRRTFVRSWVSLFAWESASGGLRQTGKNVYLRYFKHWRDRLGFPTVRQWCTNRLFVTSHWSSDTTRHMVCLESPVMACTAS